METAASILVIIVSSVLAVFLIALIVLIVMIINLIKKVRVIADQAEKAVDNVAAAGIALKNASGPVAVIRMIAGFVKKKKIQE